MGPDSEYRAVLDQHARPVFGHEGGICHFSEWFLADLFSNTLDNHRFLGAFGGHRAVRSGGQVPCFARGVTCTQDEPATDPYPPDGGQVGRARGSRRGQPVARRSLQSGGGPAPRQQPPPLSWLFVAWPWHAFRDRCYRLVHSALCDCLSTRRLSRATRRPVVQSVSTARTTSDTVRPPSAARMSGCVVDGFGHTRRDLGRRTDGFSPLRSALAPSHVWPWIRTRELQRARYWPQSHRRGGSMRSTTGCAVRTSWRGLAGHWYGEVKGRVTSAASAEHSVR